MIFGYEIADLILFDWSTLKSTFQLYNKANIITVAFSIVINIFLVFYLGRMSGAKTVYFFLAYGWIFSGYMFFIKRMSEIYWPAKFAGYYCIAVGILLVTKSFQPDPGFFSSKKHQIRFAIFSLGPTFGTLLLSFDHVLTIGTSATVSALATLSLFLPQRNKWAYTISILSLVWCLTVMAFLWALTQLV